MRSRTILNAALFFAIVFTVSSLIGFAVALAVKEEQVFVHVGKSYYSSTMETASEKAGKGFFNFGEESDNILSYNIFDAQNRMLTLPQMQGQGENGGGEGDVHRSESREASIEDIVYYIENPGKCPALTSLTIGGTIVADQWEESVALLKEGKGRSENVYVSRVGDEVTDGIKVGFVWRNLIIFNTNQGIRCIGEGVGEAKVQQPEPRVADRGRPAPKSDDDFEIKQVGENQYVIRRQDIQKATGNLNALATQARIIPARKENGFRILNIRNGSLYQKIGIQNGDVIKSINGIDISSPDKALEAYSRLQSASKISIDIVRRGGNQTLEYTIE
jgi:general secretion pathway protein C